MSGPCQNDPSLGSAFYAVVVTPNQTLVFVLAMGFGVLGLFAVAMAWRSTRLARGPIHYNPIIKLLAVVVVTWRLLSWAFGH